MKKISQFIMTVMLSLVVVGCSSQKNAENPDQQAAAECVNKIDSIAKGKPGTVNRVGIRKEDGVVARTGGSALKEDKQTWLPYVEATLLDNGVPGSAWHNCMQQHGVHIGA
ncbi:hypothetical protein ACKURH_26695 [Enterobacter soli]|uniref:hypothetical protein n=1 Tax=Enterobacter TaxID=547 RepID=UPI0023789FD6|nr:hypothetical protein [Enterobacter soli]MDD9247095.1 hypothetical protein [Enterobacter soli]HDR2474385.1 hypothetical protein [Enterobacter soli]